MPFDIEYLGFPRRAHHILLPVRPVRAARAGFALYDNTRLHQRLARTAGMVLLNLGLLQRMYRLGPMPASLLDQRWWSEWCEQIAVPAIGAVGHVAFRFYEDRIVALLMSEAARPTAFVKIWRNPPGPPHPSPYMQPQALDRLSARGDLPFRVPALIAEGSFEGWSYEMFEPLPDGKHRPIEPEPVLLARIFDAMYERLADLPRGGGVPSHYVLAHGDFSARNVRRAADGNVWILDWEFVGWAPRLADELFFWTAELARRVRQRPAAHGRRVVALLRARGSEADIHEALRWETVMTPRQMAIARAVGHQVGYDGPISRRRSKR